MNTKIIEELKGRFQQLSEREQKLVLLSGLIMVIGIVYFLIYAPIQNTIVQGEKSVRAKKELLTWVTQNANKALQLQQSGSQQGKFTGSLPQAVNQTASRQNINIARMQPQGDDLQVWVDNASFDSVLNWLQALENRGIKITEADVAEGNGPGNVKIRRLRLSKT